MAKGRSKQEVAVAAAVLKARLEQPPAAPMWGPSVDDFYWQHQFLNDPHRLKAILAPRRSAKSYGPGLQLMRGVAETPGWAGLYLTKTIGLAEEIMWEPILKAIDTRFELGLEFNQTKHTVTGKGRLRLYGVDASPDEVKKTVGKPHDDVVIDEVAMFNYDIDDLVNKYIYPSLIDRKGRLTLVSSPSDYARGYFYELTKDLPEAPGMEVRTNSTGTWHVYHWTPRENPYVRENWELEHSALLAANPLVVQTPAYQQMWLGRWVVDDSNLVYKFSLTRDVIPALPKGRYECVLGIDLGHSPDPTAFVVIAWSEFDQVAYVVHAEAELELDFSAVADRAKALSKKWGVVAQVVDGANKQGVAEMNNRLGLQLEAAEKTGKHEYQKLLSAALIMEQLKLVDQPTRGLQKELTELVWWQEKRMLIPPKFVEHPKLPNHMADAMLYAWRYTYSHLSKPREPDKSAAQAQKEAAIEAAVQRQRRKERSTEEPDGWGQESDPFGGAFDWSEPQGGEW